LLSSIQRLLINRGAKQQSTIFIAALCGQEHWDYQESWQPALISDKIYRRKIWPKKVTGALGGAGLLEWFS
jgi:formate-dependent phosphoribosylglycinamide formyltransferase (GAR transformylase)